MSAEYNKVEISIKFLTNDYKETWEAYVQRVNFEWYMTQRPMLVQQIVAVVNGLEFPVPEYKSAVPPGSFVEVK